MTELKDLLSANNIIIILIVIIMVLVAWYFSRPARLHIKSGLLHISGLHGKIIDIHKITYVWFSDTLPAGIVRENENSPLSTYKAKYYTPDKSEKYTILLNANHSHYLYIRTADNETLVWNDKDRKYMEYVAETLLNNLNKRI